MKFLVLCTMNPNNNSDHDQRHRRQDHQTIVYIAEVVECLRNHLNPSNVPEPSNSRKKPTITRIKPYPRPLPIPSRKDSTDRYPYECFQTSHQDTVRNDQTDKYGKLFVHIIGKRFKTSLTIVTSAATTTNCTIIRIRLGIVLRSNEIITLAKPQQPSPRYPSRWPAQVLMLQPTQSKYPTSERQPGCFCSTPNSTSLFYLTLIPSFTDFARLKT